MRRTEREDGSIEIQVYSRKYNLTIIAWLMGL